MLTVTLFKGTLPSFIALLEEVDAFGGLYRGHKDSSWKLTPSLYRYVNVESNDLEAAYASLEMQGVNEFFSRGVTFLSNYQRDPDSDIVMAQHFGVPTRLLDWTRDPLVALYFALSEPLNEIDAAVYYILPRGGGGSITRVNQEIGVYLPRAVDQRILAQKSIFTVHKFRENGGYYVPIDERTDHLTGDKTQGLTFLVKIIIPHKRKQELFWDLRRMGIDSASIFPGLGGIGAAIAEERQVKSKYNITFSSEHAENMKSGRLWRKEPLDRDTPNYFSFKDLRRTERS